MSRRTATRLAVALAAALCVVARADGLPVARSVPGGIVIVPVPDAASVVRVEGRKQPVLESAGGYRAVVGVPLGAGEAIDIDVNGHIQTHVLSAPGYREQHLSIERQDYVTPSAEQLARYRRERAALDAAILRFSPAAPVPFPWTSPTPGRRSDSFGARRFYNGQARRPHSGMDIAAPAGTPVRSAAAGEVVLTEDLFFNGRTVVVDHGNGFVTLYCHLSEADVAPGTRVAAGERLGRVGATGRVTGPHLHVSVYVGGMAVDPALLLGPAERR